MKDFDIYDIEFMAARFNPVLTGNSFLDTRYNWQKNENGVEWPYYRFFHHLAKTLQPELVVELGGWRGTAAAHFAKGQAGCQVITIDHHTDPGDEAHKEKMLEAQRECPNLIYLQAWSCDKIAGWEIGKHQLGDRPSAFQLMDFSPSSIDILFIDSWHVYEYALADWEAYKPLLKSPSLVICDDIIDNNREGDPISGMMRFWKDLPEPKFLNSNLHPGSQMGFIKYEKDNV
jgi:predicted O-methyltransferase YrrM